MALRQSQCRHSLFLAHTRSDQYYTSPVQPYPLLGIPKVGRWKANMKVNLGTGRHQDDRYKNKKSFTLVHQSLQHIAALGFRFLSSDKEETLAQQLFVSEGFEN